MVAHVLRLKEGQKVQLLAPLVRGRKGQHLDVFQAIRRAGLIRARVDGEMIEVTEVPPALAKTRVHTIEAVVDRLSIREGIRPRLAESLDLALKLSGGDLLTLTESPTGWDEQVLSINLNCPKCGTSLPAVDPRGFSFNSPYGACPTCQGLGSQRSFRRDLVVPDRALSWEQGAVAPWSLVSSSDTDAASIDSLVRDFLARHGAGRRPAVGIVAVIGLGPVLVGRAVGILSRPRASARSVLSRSASDSLRRGLDVYREEVPCSACGGSRLRPEALAIKIDGRSIDDTASQPIGGLLTFFRSIRFEPELEPVATPVIVEIVSRLQYLVDVGLEYLSLGRGSDTLSGGELQRARLAAQLGSGLTGVCTILDEPTAGLHHRDTARLITSVRRLLDQGNSVLVVEHDLSVIEAADWVVDLGPGAGPDGGSVVAAGPPDQLAKSTTSITAPIPGPGSAAWPIGASVSVAVRAGSRSRARPFITSSKLTFAFRSRP